MWKNTASKGTVQAASIQGRSFGPAQEFIVSPQEEIGKGVLFEIHAAGYYHIAVLPNGDHSFAACVQALKKADTTVHIQALVLTVDESGLYIRELLKQKKTEGLDVRIIVDAMSNPVVQTSG